jgi:arginyl-tRNA synthetase
MEKIKNIIKKAFEKLGVSLETIEISIPNEKIKFHYCTNALFSTQNVNQEALINCLKEDSLVSKAEIINQYINLEMNEKFFEEELLRLKNSPAFLNIGHNEKVNVEYCSVNPTGFLHIGHARNAIIGDAIANILKNTGYDVTKEYYVNDGGAQVELLAKSIYARYLELQGKPLELPEGGYISEDLKEVAKKITAQDSLETISKIGVKYFVENIKKDLAAAGIEHDIWVYESTIIKEKYIEKAIEALKQKNLIYEGSRDDKKAEKGVQSGEKLILLKTTEFGDDADRPLTKGNGSWTYFAPDIGYHFNKIERGFKYLICTLGADHDSYAKRIKIAVKGLKEDIKHETPICQMVTFEKEGKNVKFSKRLGNSTRVSEFIEEVSKDIVRFIMLSKKAGTPFTFDYDKACEISMQNPVFYVQYAYARAHSILRNQNQQQQNNQHQNKQNQTNTTQEITKTFTIQEYQNLMIALINWEEVQKETVEKLAPQILVNYAIKLAEKFHSLWHSGKIDPQKRFIIDDTNESQARIRLINQFIKTLGATLSSLGISLKEKME